MVNPAIQIGYIQQSLSQDKRPLGLFIGAGCPVSIKVGTNPLVPNIAGLTKHIEAEISKDKECAPLMKMVEGHFAKDGRTDLNVETLLSHIRGLRSVAGKDSARGLSSKNLEDLDAKICELIHVVVDKALPSLDTPYHQVARWVDAVTRVDPVEIFTTNYDLLIEQALEDSNVPYFDGFAGGRRPFFDIRAMEEDKLPPRWARLWKLHGSINWYQDPSRPVVLRGGTKEAGLKRVIHPSHLKYDESRRMPYLAMIDRLRAFLKQPSAVLVVSGYSFGDEHLNEVLVQELRGNRTAIGFGLLFGDTKNYPKATKLARERRNLTLLAADAGVIGGESVQWTEADSTSIPKGPCVGMSWKPINAADPASKVRATVELGDFAVFGKFLHQLSGPTI